MLEVVLCQWVIAEGMFGGKVNETYPTSFGRKKLLQASMMIPLRANTKPTFAFSYAILIVIGRHIVIPTPTAAPWIAAIVGFLQR